MMLTLLTYCLLVLSSLPFQSGHSIKKRDIFQFATIIEVVTNKKATSFNGYGNYCGYGGNGMPVDNIDRCCMRHDYCYGHICSGRFTYYISRYKWYYNGYNIICANENRCLQLLCLCDRRAAFCFARYMKDYNSRHLSLWGKFFKKFWGFI